MYLSDCMRPVFWNMSCVEFPRHFICVCCSLLGNAKKFGFLNIYYVWLFDIQIEKQLEGTEIYL